MSTATDLMLLELQETQNVDICEHSTDENQVIKPLHLSYNTKSETECMYRKAAAKSIHSKYLRLP